MSERLSSWSATAGEKTPLETDPSPAVNTSGRARAPLLLVHPAALATNSRCAQMWVPSSPDDNSKLILAHIDPVVQLQLRCKVDVSVNLPDQPITRRAHRLPPRHGEIGMVVNCERHLGACNPHDTNSSQARCNVRMSCIDHCSIRGASVG